MEDANQLELPNSIQEFLARDIGTISGIANIARSWNDTTPEESKGVFSFLGTIGEENQELELSASNRGMYVYFLINYQVST